MYLKKSISNGKPYLSFVQGYRQDGRVKQKTIEKLGYLEDLEKLYEDPVSHFKEVAKQRTLSEHPHKTLEINITKRLPNNATLRKNLGYAVPKSIYSLLGIHSFFQKRQRHLNIKYNLNSIFSLLIYNRFLFPSSKKKAFDNRDFFFESYDFSIDDLYRSLDYFARYSEPLQKYLHEKVCEIIGRDGKLGYYDVTNYYFEIPYNDEDKYDDNGVLVKKGLRSHDHRW